MYIFPGVVIYVLINGIVEEADLTDAELIIIEHCGHVCNIDQSRQFNDIISELLDIE